jgi:hypothetical protein
MPKGAPQDPRSSPQPGDSSHRGEGDRREAGRGGLAESPGNLQRHKFDSELRILKPRGGHGPDSEWCHPRGGYPLQAPRLLQEGDPGTGSDQSEGAKDSEVPVEDDLRIGHRLRIREERGAHFS